MWNRTAEKCKDFVKAGAKEAMTPGDVIAECDITFSCVSDPQAAKDMVFGNCGVLSEINTVKGYVEMTGIDADTSQDIAEAINLKGGRYLEAQVQGSKDESNDGTLVVLVAGDRSLFDDCQSCFQVIMCIIYSFSLFVFIFAFNFLLEFKLRIKIGKFSFMRIYTLIVGAFV